MTIGATIKKLRREQNITQEQLAEFLGVTAQAVSRWETGTALPDIAQLPALANIFNVSSDQLLGIDVDTKEARIDTITNDASVKYWAGQKHEALNMIRNALKEYPNSYKLMRDLFIYTWVTAPSHPQLDDEEGMAKHHSMLRECLDIGEKILAGCTDNAIRYRVIEQMCHMYATLGNNDKALELANTMPDSNRSETLLGVYHGTQRYRHWQSVLYSTCNFLMNHVYVLPFVQIDDGTNPYTFDEAIHLAHKALEIANIMCEDGNFGHRLIWRFADIHSTLAFLYTRNGDTDAALKHLQLTTKYFTEYAINDSDESVLTSLVFRGYKDVNFSGAADLAEQLLQAIAGSAFDTLRTSTIYCELEEELKKYASVND